MPILEVAALPQPAHVNLSGVAVSLSRAVAAQLGEDPSGTWVVWRTIEPGSYVEGDRAPALQPASTHPPLVRVVAYEGRPPETVTRILATTAETLVAALGLAEGNAFVVWDELHAGRVYAGGSILGA